MRPSRPPLPPALRSLTVPGSAARRAVGAMERALEASEALLLPVDPPNLATQEVIDALMRPRGLEALAGGVNRVEGRADARVAGVVPRVVPPVPEGADPRARTQPSSRMAGPSPADRLAVSAMLEAYATVAAGTSSGTGRTGAPIRQEAARIRSGAANGQVGAPDDQAAVATGASSGTGRTGASNRQEAARSRSGTANGQAGAPSDQATGQRGRTGGGPGVTPLTGTADGRTAGGAHPGRAESAGHGPVADASTTDPAAGRGRLSYPTPARKQAPDLSAGQAAGWIRARAERAGGRFAADTPVAGRPVSDEARALLEEAAGSGPAAVRPSAPPRASSGGEATARLEQTLQRLGLPGDQEAGSGTRGRTLPAHGSGGQAPRGGPVPEMSGRQDAHLEAISSETGHFRREVGGSGSSRPGDSGGGPRGLRALAAMAGELATSAHSGASGSSLGVPSTGGAEGRDPMAGGGVGFDPLRTSAHGGPGAPPLSRAFAERLELETLTERLTRILQDEARRSGIDLEGLEK